MKDATHRKYRKAIERLALQRDKQLEGYYMLQPSGQAGLYTAPSARTRQDEAAIAAYLRQKESLADAQEALNAAYAAYNKALVRSIKRDAKH